MIQNDKELIMVLTIALWFSLIGLALLLLDKITHRCKVTTKLIDEDEDEEKQPPLYKEVITRITVKDDRGYQENYYTSNDNGLGWSHVDGRLVIRQYLNPSNTLYNSLAVLTNHCILLVVREILDLKTGTIHTPEKTINDLQHYFQTGEYEKKL